MFNMEEILAMATVLAAVVTGVTEVLKKSFKMNKRFVPLASLAVGILLGAAAYFIDAEVGIRMWAGGIAGLMGTGLFEAGKNMKGDK